MRPFRSVCGLVFLSAAIVPASSGAAESNCGVFNFRGYRVSELRGTAACPTTRANAARIIIEGTGFLRRQGWACYETRPIYGAGAAGCRRGRLSFDFTFRLVSLRLTGALFEPDSITGTQIDEKTLSSRVVQRRLSRACPAGQAINQVAQNGEVVCTAGTGVTSVGSGTGLSGGPITAAGEISLNPNYRLPQACSTGQVPRADGAGLWLCGDTAGGTVTSVDSGTGLTGGPVTNSGSLSIAKGYQLPQNCANGQVAQSDGANGWTCAADQNSGGTVTSITAGSGLSGGTINDSGTIAVNPAQTQSRVTGSCGGTSAIRAVAQSGAVTCTSNFENSGHLQHTGYVQLNDNPSQTATLINFGGAIIRATCTSAGNALIELGSNGGAAAFLDYQLRSTTIPNQGASVANGNFTTLLDTATNGSGQVNIITSTFSQVDISFFGWAIATTGGADCVFAASGLTF